MAKKTRRSRVARALRDPGRPYKFTANKAGTRVVIASASPASGAASREIARVERAAAAADRQRKGKPRKRTTMRNPWTR